MKERKLNNSGYTLVELIIVIAVIAVVSVMSVASISIIHSAKAKDASVTFNSEVSTLSTKCKNMSVSYDSNNDGIDENYPNFQYAIKVYKDANDDYYIVRGYYDTTTGNYVFAGTDSMNGGMGLALSSYCTVSYTPIGGSEDMIDSDGICIRYDNKGNCVEGAGRYNFYKKNQNVVAYVLLRKNGSHELK